MNLPINYWLETIADAKVRESALRQINTESSCNKLKDAIYCFCRWYTTPEGWNFWLDVYNKALEGKLKLRDYITPDEVWMFTESTGVWMKLSEPDPLTTHIHEVTKAIELLKNEGYLIFKPNSNL